jgi:hypothetical protein
MGHKKNHSKYTTTKKQKHVRYHGSKGMIKPTLGLTTEDVYGLSLKDIKKFNNR